MARGCKRVLQRCAESLLLLGRTPLSSASASVQLPGIAQHALTQRAVSVLPGVASTFQHTTYKPACPSAAANQRVPANTGPTGLYLRACSHAATSAPSTSSESTAGPMSYLMLIPSAVAALLAFWQLDRRNTKVAQLERRRAALHSAPQDVFSMDHVPQAYDLVTWTGTYKHEDSMFVGPRVKTHMGVPSKGWQLVTPCLSPDGKRGILVRRGWVPDSWKTGADGLELLRRSHDAARDIGVVTTGEIGNSFTAPNVPEKGEWFFLDVAAMAQASGLPDNTPMVEVVDVSEEAGHAKSAMQIVADKYRGIPHQSPTSVYPLPKKRDEYLDFSVMPYDHLNYAATWFLLSIATGYLAFRLIRGLPAIGKRRSSRS